MIISICLRPYSTCSSQKNVGLVVFKNVSKAGLDIKLMVFYEYRFVSMVSEI